MEGSPSLAAALQALRREPGVLLVDVNATGTLAVVAHDPAVQASSLLAAIARTGGAATIAAGERPAALGVDAVITKARLRFRYLATAAAGLLVGLALVDRSFPKSAGQHWLLPIVLSSLWGIFFAEALVRRRS